MRAAGETVDRYTIVTLLGQGGMGEVYEAEDAVLKRRVALKLIPRGSDPEARERMLREARLAAAFEHPNAVTVFDAGVVDDGTPTEETFLAMEIVRGRSLRAYVGDRETSLPKKLRWLVDAARALGAAHRAGLIHRDVKPDNLMVRADGRLKVLDFGIAKRAASPIDPSAPTEAPKTRGPITEKGSFVGTPTYAAPEQLRGDDVDGRTDQYGWGVTAYELCGGVAPFRADSGVALLSRILTTEAPGLSEEHREIPREVDAVILKTLSKDPDERFPSMDAVADALEPFADHSLTSDAGAGSAVPKRSSTPVVRVVRRFGRVFVVLAAAFGTLVIAVLGLGALLGKVHLDAGVGSSASASASASVNAEQPKPLVGFACSEARVTGNERARAISRAIGIGACARLAIEAGVPFSHPKATDAGVYASSHAPVDVEANIGSMTTVTIRAVGYETTVEGTSPMIASQRAVAALAPMLPVVPVSDRERASWGAATDESARRIEKVWRRLLQGDLQNPETASRELCVTDGDSPWSHAILGLVAPRGGAESKQAGKAILERLGRVPPARAKALEGVAILLTEPGRQDNVVKLFRQSYRDAPDDADIAGLYGAVVLDSAADEGFGVIERVAKEFPTRAIIPLANAITGTQIRDPARNARYIARLNDIHPEKACEGYQFTELLLNLDVPAARERRDECEDLYGKDNGAFPTELIGAEIELAALDPDKARELAQRKLGDAQEAIRSEAARLVIGAYLLGGRLAEASAAMEAEMKRQRDQENPRLAVQRAVTRLRLDVLVGQAPSDDLLEFIRTAHALDEGIPVAAKARVQAFLASTKKTSKKDAEAAAAAILQSKNPNDAFQLVGLLRRVKGDRETWKLLSPQHQRVATRVLYVSGLDVALLMEAVHAPEADVEARYRLAMMPAAFDLSGLDKCLARLRLAAIYDKTGRAADAQKLRAEVDRAWIHADPGVREIAAKLE